MINLRDKIIDILNKQPGYDFDIIEASFQLESLIAQERKAAVEEAFEVLNSMDTYEHSVYGSPLPRDIMPIRQGLTLAKMFPTPQVHQ